MVAKCRIATQQPSQDPPGIERAREGERARARCVLCERESRERLSDSLTDRHTHTLTHTRTHTTRQ